MQNAAKMTGKQKIEFIRDRTQSIREGKLSWILCPYCGGENTPVDDKVCCPLFYEAVMAVTDRMDKEAAIEFIGKVADRVN